MQLTSNCIEEVLIRFYSNDTEQLQNVRRRYDRIVEVYRDRYDGSCLDFFSAPGRVELGGNHTDHNHGRVLAASIHLDSIAVASANGGEYVNIVSEGYSDPFIVNLSHLGKVKNESGSTSALIRGIASRIRELNYNIGGFNAVIASDVLPGSGLSSSASIEILIGTIFNHLFNQGRMSPLEIAKIGQYAENEYFEKPCGLMDQMTCAVGGIVAIDFIDPVAPNVEKIDFNFCAENYGLVIVKTGGSHHDLTEDYAAIPEEMKTVARKLNATVCREIERGQLKRNIHDLRHIVGDRAILRALHFDDENNRVLQQINALKMRNLKKFLSLVNDSGNSSFKWLQNVYSIRNVREQGVPLALKLTEDYIADTGSGACRVHGGGFAGTILAILHEDHFSSYREQIESVFGEGSVLVLNIRSEGAVKLNQN